MVVVSRGYFRAERFLRARVFCCMWAAYLCLLPPISTFNASRHD